MAGKEATSNPLITTKPSEAALSIQLHPLVLLTITDYITRHTSRQQDGPIIGAIIGQQNGRSFTLEHAYECKTVPRDGGVVLDAEWFEERLSQYRDVHKAPALDLVGLFMLGPAEGPVYINAHVMKQVQELTAADPLMLLLFHPELAHGLQGGKLPITLYESVSEQESGGDVEMKFRELSFEVETGEAEMIGVDFVAKGGGNASAVIKGDARTAAGASSTSASEPKDKKGKGKSKSTDSAPDTNGATASSLLSAEDDELIASLTAKSNAIKMLNDRLNLIRSYLRTQMPSYLTDATDTTPPPETRNHTLLRSINAMLSRLPLLAPPTSANASTTAHTDSAAQKEKSDVHLTTLLASLTRAVADANAMSSKFATVSREKTAKDRGPMGRGGGRFGLGDDGGLLSGDSAGGF